MKNHYPRELKLVIYRRIGVTKQVYEILRLNKRQNKISMAKYICNLVMEKQKDFTIPNTLKDTK